MNMLRGFISALLFEAESLFFLKSTLSLFCYITPGSKQKFVSHGSRFTTKCWPVWKSQLSIWLQTVLPDLIWAVHHQSHLYIRTAHTYITEKYTYGCMDWTTWPETFRSFRLLEVGVEAGCVCLQGTNELRADGGSFIIWVSVISLRLSRSQCSRLSCVCVC